MFDKKTTLIDLYKINENFDMANQIKSLAFTPTLNNSTFLFDEFFPAILGKDLTHDDIGVKSYEKTSNFILNNSDVDTCGIDQLYNLANSINENTDDYMLNYPSEIKRLMDITSINQSRLWGSNAKNQNNFKYTSKEGILNRGNILSSNYSVSAGTPVILKTVSLDSYNLIPTGLLSGLSSYSLETLIDFIGLKQDSWRAFYEFYETI